MVGTIMMAMALSSGRAKLISPMAIGGMPMPIAPLAMPATIKAPAITSTCSKLIPPGLLLSVDLRGKPVERLPELRAQRVGLHHDLVLGAGHDDVLAVLEASDDGRVARDVDQLVLAGAHQQERQLDALEIARRQLGRHRALG